MSKTKQSVTFALLLPVFCLLTAGVLYYPQEMSVGISHGINYSLAVLLPSLFPFMFLVSFASASGIADVIGNRISDFTNRVLSLPGDASVTVVLSLIGGYPVGAVGISELLRKKRITCAQARRMLLFCVNPGPAFLINTIGITLLHDQRIGLVLLCANTISALIIGVVSGVFSKEPQGETKFPTAAVIDRNIPDAVVTAVKSSCGGCVSLCSFVVLFSGFSQVLLSIIPFGSDLYKVLLQAFLEATDGASALCEMRLPIYVIAAAAAWGGVCVHLQVMAAVPEIKVMSAWFVLGRLTMAFLSAGVTYLICRYVCPDVEVFSNISETAAAASSLAPNGSIMLLVCCIMFLIFIMPCYSDN
ncbi:MAG: hypothetical protein IIY78_07325 [Clostridia bacterium]|nr:hypothetical protein [Clostridia bacterium]